MGKKKNKNKIVDAFLPAEMTRPEMLGHIVRLQAEQEREKEERNYYFLEREKIIQLWNLLLELIQIEKEKLAMLNSTVMDAQRNKEEEDNLYNQKLRFLKQEHTRKLGQVRLYHLGQMKHAQDDAWALHMVIREALMGKKKEIRQAQLAFYQIIRGLHWKHATDVSNLRKELAQEIRRLETNFDRRLFEMNDKREEEQEREVQILASSKEEQVHKLIDSHRYQTKELQKFFRDLIRHNLALIYGMKDAAKKQKTFELRARKDFQGFKLKYEKYIAAAVKWKQDMAQWAIDHKDDNLEELVQELDAGNEELKHLRHTQRMMECSNETLKQRILIAEKERNNLNKEFQRSAIDIQKRTSMARFVSQVKKKAAKRDGDFYEALADNVEKDGADETDYYMSLLSSREHELEDIRADITDHATEHKNVEENYMESFLRNEINLADIGFPIKKTGAQARGVEEDIFNTENERDTRASSNKKRSKMDTKKSKKFGAPSSASSKSSKHNSPSASPQRKTI